MGFSLASALSSLVLFLLPSSVHVLSASFPFHGFCAFLFSFSSRSSGVCLSSALVAWRVFWLLFSYFIVRSLRPRLLSSSVLFFFFFFFFCTFESFRFLCVFLRSCTVLPVFVFHTSSILLLGYSFVRALRACVVFVFGCIGVLFVLPCSPSPPSGLGSVFPPCCSVFLAVLRCPVVPLCFFLLLLSLPPLPFLSGFGFGSGFFSCITPFPFPRISYWHSVFYLLPLRSFRLGVSLVFGCRFVNILLLLLCSRFVLSQACYPSFVGWFLACFASSSSCVCCVSGFLPARLVSWFRPLDFLVLFRPLLPLSLCVLFLRLITVRLSGTFLS